MVTVTDKQAAVLEALRDGPLTAAMAQMAVRDLVLRNPHVVMHSLENRHLVRYLGPHYAPRFEITDLGRDALRQARRRSKTQAR